MKVPRQPDSIYALRILRSPTVCEAPSRFRPGLYCRGIMDAFLGGGLGEAAFYVLPLGAATALAEAEARHPGMVVEIAEFREQDETCEHALARQLAEITIKLVGRPDDERDHSQATITRRDLVTLCDAVIGSRK